MKLSLSLLLAAATSSLAWSPPGTVRDKSHLETKWGRRVDHKGHRGWRGQGQLPSGTCEPTPKMGNTTFTQYIDHKNPHLGTFEQRYWWNTEWWAGPGSPVIVFTPGEANASDYTWYLTNGTNPGVLAQKTGGAVLMIEHRYWGTSVPFDGKLTTQNLQYLNLHNNLEDFIHFAKTVKLPFAKHGSNAADAPWVMTGGSYSGAISAWTESIHPGVYWAYHASSAPVQAISNYWEYFTPVQEGMPKNCSKDLSAVIEHMDHVLATGSKKEVHDLKAQFALQDLEHNDDFMAALENAPWLWQGNQFYTGYSDFFVMCDSVEGVYNKTGAHIPDANGVGLEKALPNFANWFKTLFLPGACEKLSNGYPEFKGEMNTKCYETHDPKNPMFTDISVSNKVDRAWVWMTCNEPVAYWQNGAPEGRPSIVSRLINDKFSTDQCDLFFPKDPKTGATYGIARGISVDDTNRYTKGWDQRESKRLIYVNGGFDPWRESGVASSVRPGGPLKSTANVPALVVPGGFHTSDMITYNGQYNAGCGAVIAKMQAQLITWIKEFPKRRHWSA